LSGKRLSGASGLLLTRGSYIDGGGIYWPCQGNMIVSEEMRTLLKLVIALVLCAPAVLAQKSTPLRDLSFAG
jgi:hypothetical protein